MATYSCSICQQKDAQPVGMLSNALLGFNEDQNQNVCLDCRKEFNAVDFSKQPVIRQFDRVCQAIFLNRKKIMDGTAKYPERMIQGMMQVILLLIKKGVLGKYASADAENIVKQLRDKSGLIESASCVKSLIINSATSIPTMPDECESQCETMSVDGLEYSASEQPLHEILNSSCSTIISVDQLETLSASTATHKLVHNISNAKVTIIGGPNGITLRSGEDGYGIVSSEDCWGRTVARVFAADNANEAIDRLLEDRARCQMQHQQEETKRICQEKEEETKRRLIQEETRRQAHQLEEETRRQVQLQQLEEETKRQRQQLEEETKREIQRQQLEEETKRQTLLREYELAHCPKKARAAAECQVIAAEVAQRIATIVNQPRDVTSPVPAAKRQRLTSAVCTVADALSKWLEANPCSSDDIDAIFSTDTEKTESVKSLVAQKLSMPLFTMFLVQYVRLKHNNDPMVLQALCDIDHSEHAKFFVSATEFAKHASHVLVCKVMPELRNNCKTVLSAPTLTAAAPIATVLARTRGELARKLELFDEGATRTALRCLTAALIKATGYVVPVFAVPTPLQQVATTAAKNCLRKSGNPDRVSMKELSLFENRPSPYLCNKIIKQEVEKMDHDGLLKASTTKRGNIVTVSWFLRNYMERARGEAREQHTMYDPDDWVVPAAINVLRRWKVIVGGPPQFYLKHSLEAAVSIILVMRNETPRGQMCSKSLPVARV